MKNEEIINITKKILKENFKNYEVEIEEHYLLDDFYSLNIKLKLLYGVNVYFTVSEWEISLLKEHYNRYIRIYEDKIIKQAENEIVKIFRKGK